jgi:hypothetical protein
MEGRTYRLLALAGMASMALTAGLVCHAQYGQTGGGGGGVLMQEQVGSRQQNGFNAGPDLDPIFAAKRMRALNADRQKSMVSDANKLLRLARQLDAEIASNPTDALTGEEMRKVEEIEKLARNVKTKMAQSFEGGPQVRPPGRPIGGPGTD